MITIMNCLELAMFCLTHVKVQKYTIKIIQTRTHPHAKKPQKQTNKNNNNKQRNKQANK